MKNFCVIPWYSRELDLVTGTERVCCWIDDAVSRQDLQIKFKSYEQPEECNKCWQAELRGHESRRQMENRFLDYKMDRDITVLQQDALCSEISPNMYQLFLGSTCNGTCVTCGSHASSSWRALEQKTISIRAEQQQSQLHFDQFAETIDWCNAKRFNLLGGEPLLIHRSFDILRALLHAHNTDCRVSFVTNGSVTPSDNQIKIIQQFSDISCCVSIDGIDKLFEYIRYPLSWPKMLSNITLYREIFSEVIVSFTVSNLNYHARKDIINWFQDQKLLYIENYVTSPPWFRFNVDPSHELWPRFVKEISHQDEIKGINIENYLPHIADLIQKTWR